MDSGQTVGVEEEFFLVDGAGQLVQGAPEALEGADRTDVDLKPELLRCQVESATEVCRTAEELLDELTGLRARLAEGAARGGARLVASGTVVHPQRAESLVGPGSRYHRIAEHFGWLVVRGPICGCHVHVGIADRALALRVANHLRPWLPVLLALSANSPFVEGRDTGYASSRHLVWSRWPSAGPPPYLDSVDQYESIMASLLDTGAALDRKTIYWDIRPSEHQPTVEVRVADVLLTARDATLLAVLVRTLVRHALDELDAGRQAPRVPTEVIRAGLWRAAKDGLGGNCPDPVTGRLRPVRAIIEELIQANTVPLKETGELDFVLSTMDQQGGAHRQRKAFDNGELAGVLDAITVIASP